MGLSNITEPGQNDISDHMPNSFREHRVATASNLRKTSIADADEESDSNSDDGHSSSLENDESPISEDSDNLMKSQITSPLHNLTLGSDTSADSVKSIISGIIYREALTRSSSESSLTSTSDEESDGGFYFSEEARRSRREEWGKKFTETKQSANNRTDNEDLENDPSKIDNGADNMSLRSDNNTVSSQNQQSGITSENDSDDDDGGNVRTRGHDTKNKFSGKRYHPIPEKDRENHRSNHTTETRSLETHTGKSTTEDGSVTKDVTDWLTELYRAPDITPESLGYLFQALEHLENVQQVDNTSPSISSSTTSPYDGSPIQSPEKVYPRTVPQPLASGSSGYFSDNNENFTSNSSHQMNAVPSVAPLQAVSYTNAGSFQTPTSKKSQQLSADICYWKNLGLPTTRASKRLKTKVSAQKNFLAMMALYPIPNERSAVQFSKGNTYLMAIVSNQNILSSYLAYIGPLLSKMKTIPNSLTLRNDLGYDALYLAAINCPGFDFVTGVLAAVILRSDGASSDVWKRTYNKNRDTLIHVLAAKDDAYAAILQELFAVQESSGCTLFDLSEKNIEGKTPLLLAVEAHNRMESGIRNDKMVQLLMKYDRSPISIEDRNGTIAPYVAPPYLSQEVTNYDELADEFGRIFGSSN